MEERKLVLGLTVLPGRGWEVEEDLRREDKITTVSMEYFRLDKGVWEAWVGEKEKERRKEASSTKRGRPQLQRSDPSSSCGTRSS